MGLLERRIIYWWDRAVFFQIKKVTVLLEPFIPSISFHQHADIK